MQFGVEHWNPDFNLNLLKQPLVVLFFCLSVETLVAQSPQWEEGEGFRSAKLGAIPAARPGFTLLSPTETGILWTNLVTQESVADRHNMVSGGGLAAGDFDGDGFIDLYFCNRGGENALFRNLGNGRFQNVTATAGVGCAGQSSTGATFADVNGDGSIDLLVNSFLGPNACFLNLGNGNFTNVTQSAGLSSRGGSTSMALGDVDGDGDLDLYVAYFGVEAILREGARVSVRMIDGQPVVTGRHSRRLKIVNGKLIELGEQDILYFNDGKGRFTQADWAQCFRDENDQPVMTAPMDFGLAVQIRDINEDGHPDIYVCNDFQTPDRFWLNDGRGKFKAIAHHALRKMSYASMGVDFADFDRDGRLDFITVEMLSREHARRLRQSSSMPPSGHEDVHNIDPQEVPRNTLFWNRGDGTYAEIAWFSNLAATDWSWTPIFLDVDLDGYEDLLVSTGHLYDVNDRDATAAVAQFPEGKADPRKMLSRYPLLDSRNAAFRNRGDLTFEDMSQAWGFDSRQVCHGMALVDLDGDGDLDVALNSVNSPPLIYRNDAPAPRVAVRLKGRPPNTQAIGSKIKLIGGAIPVQSQEVVSGGRYMSGDDPIRVFAAARLGGQSRIEVVWRNGGTSVVEKVQANRIYEILEPVEVGDRKVSSPVIRSNTVPLFRDVSGLVSHTHREVIYDDFARQPLLPRRYSQLGPGVAWFDINGDGQEDLILGGGKGGKVSVHLNDGKGSFARMAWSALEAPLMDDSAAIVGWTSVAGRRSLLMGLSSYETTEKTSPSVLRYDFENGELRARDHLPHDISSTGPMAFADVDGDGSLELFVGGRVKPGRFPEAPTSKLFRQEAGLLVLDEKSREMFQGVGMVSGAVFSDLDGDGFPELILACEWGPLRVFRPQAGRWSEITSSLGLSDFVGLWNSVTTGDFDGDGRMDIIAGNWGLNSFYTQAQGVWRLYYGDFNSDGQVLQIEAVEDIAAKAIFPWRDMQTVAAAMPWVRGRFATHKTYAGSSVAQLLGDRSRKAGELSVTTLASMLFMNRGARFESRLLPMQAQWAPVMGVCVGDVNGDGREDAFLAQNFFGVRAEDARLDAGCGLWMLGDGNGGFAVMTGTESGVTVYGEQRGAGLSDFDEDGRLDFVVTQNADQTRLYQNVGARPGLRIRLKGSVGNLDGFGSQIWVNSSEGRSPVREIHGGGGYWSQDGAVQLVRTPQMGAQLQIRWPGGKTTTNSMPSGVKEILVDVQGNLQVLR